MIYLDNSATTRVLSETCGIISKYNSEKYFNPSALYGGAVEVNRDISASRKAVAGILGCGPDEVIFTSGGTESDNLAILGSVKNGRGRIIASAGEHLAVYSCFNELKNKGYDVCYAPLDKSGRMDIDGFKALLNKDTVFVSVIHASNETGAVNDLSLISGLAKSANPSCIVHSDGVQAYLKTETKTGALGVDLYSISGHKVHCPKGIGALYIKKGIKVSPILFGASQESGMRPGTENAALIYAFAKTSQELYAEIGNRINHISGLKREFISIIKKDLSGFVFNGDEETSLPNIISLSVEGIKSEILIQMLSDKGIYIGSGSACSSRQKVSRVLKELKIPPEYIEGAIRISFSHLNTAEETKIAAKEIIGSIRQLRQMVR